MEEIFYNEAARKRRERLDRRNNRPVLTCFSKRSVRQIVILFIITVVFLTSVLVIKSVRASENTSQRIKGYISVEILSGDTVWSIAEEYISPEYKSVSQLVKEIIKTNHISNGRIIAGNHLIVPVYRDIVE